MTEHTKTEAGSSHLDSLETKLRGAGTVTVCRHVDIDELPLDDPQRACVLDLGLPEGCEMTTHDAGPGRVTDKAKCEYWAVAHRVEPEPLTIEESLSLIEQVRSSTREVERVREALKPFRRAFESFDADRWDDETKVNIHLPHTKRAIPVTWVYVQHVKALRQALNGGLSRG